MNVKDNFSTQSAEIDSRIFALRTRYKCIDAQIIVITKAFTELVQLLSFFIILVLLSNYLFEDIINFVGDLHSNFN